MPCMDTPNIKFTWTAEVTVPSSEYTVHMSGKANENNRRSTPNGEVHYFT